MTTTRALVQSGVFALTLTASCLAIWWVGGVFTDHARRAGPPPSIPRGLSKPEFYNRDFVPLLEIEGAELQERRGGR